MWLHVPSAFLGSVQASACSKKDCVRAWRILESPAELSFTLKGKPLLPRSWRRLCKRAVWTKRLSGTISRPSTAGRGVAAWIASLPVSPVSRGASQDGKPGRTTTAGSGPTSRELFARLNLRFASSKTSPDLFKEEVSNPSYLTLPKAGSMRSGVILKRAPLALRTSASACSSWPTARATDGTKGGPNQRGSRGDPTLPGMTAQWATPDTSTYSNGHNVFQNLREQTALWMTPNAPTVGRHLDEHEVIAKGATDLGKRQVGLESQTKFWSTPHANCSTGAGSNGRDGGLNLQSQIAAWPTPCANDDNKSPQAHMAMKRRMKGGPRNTITSLQVLAQMWPTPAARDHKGANSAEHAKVTGGGRKHMDQLANFVEHSHRAHSILDGQELSPTHRILPRRLNPAFACWLMGFPIWWTSRGLTNSVKSEMESYRSKQQQLLSDLLDER